MFTGCLSGDGGIMNKNGNVRRGCRRGCSNMGSTVLFWADGY